MRVPTRSDGTRSGVNWTRRNCRRAPAASVLTVSVLASPGTPSSSTWPPASSATSRRSSIASWPTITRLSSYSASSSPARGSSRSRGGPRASRLRRASSWSERGSRQGVAASGDGEVLLHGVEPAVDCRQIRISAVEGRLEAPLLALPVMRILVAEDEPRIAAAVARGLRREGMAVDVAARRRRGAVQGARQPLRRRRARPRPARGARRRGLPHADRRAAAHEGADAHRGALDRRARPGARRWAPTTT